MNKLFFAASLLALCFATTVRADESPAAAAYPLKTCVVSGDALGSDDMGPPIDYIHKEEGKPDRLVRLCCKACIRTFKKDPAAYLAKIDAAAAATPATPSAAK
ncbi:hypothetical protein [Rariglobus hedericola]|uniref:hypothetical protein n=1 Tax=Rariglobus hedericola TaxID=2597822 RepID=UPI001EF0C1AF|nr:hypothetical protein [Rariglobus hedericola]